MGGSELFSSSSLVEMAFPNILTGISVKVYPETELGCVQNLREVISGNKSEDVDQGDRTRGEGAGDWLGAHRNHGGYALSLCRQRKGALGHP